MVLLYKSLELLKCHFLRIVRGVIKTLSERRILLGDDQSN